MKNVGRLLETQRRAERDFVTEAASETTAPKGWTAALTMFHVARWRGRLWHALSEHSEDRPFDPPTGNIDEFNDAELPAGAGMSLAEASSESDAALGALINLWHRLGDRPFDWYMATTTAEALVRNSFSHPRIHMAGYFLERGDASRSNQLMEETASDLRQAEAPPHILGAALCNLAGARVREGRLDEALTLLEEALPMHTDLAAPIAADPDFAPLRDSPRFQKLIG